MILDLPYSRDHGRAIQNPHDSMKCILCVFTKFPRINHHPIGGVNMNSRGSNPQTSNRIRHWEIAPVPMEALPSLPTVIYGWQPPRKHIDTIGCNGSDGAFMCYRASDPQTMSLWEVSQLPSPKLPLQAQGLSRYFLWLRDDCGLRLLKLSSRHLHYSNEPPPREEKMKTSYRRKAFSHWQWCGCRCICFKLWLNSNSQIGLSYQALLTSYKTCFVYH